jgi:peptidoglycan glycosyltransferase
MMAGSIRRTGVILGLLLLALLVNLSLIQTVRAENLNERNDNARTLIREYSYPRGPIVVGADPVALSVADQGTLEFLRTYADGPLYAPATGFYSLVYGRTAIEEEENSVLSGTDPGLSSQPLLDSLLRRPTDPGSAMLTLNADAQAAAFEGLGNQRGAVVALEPNTGRILALASTPSYDPNTLSGQDTAAVSDAYNAYNEDPDQPLLNRPLARTYPPGSTFKLVTAAAALMSGEYTPETEIPGPASLPLPDTNISLSNLGNRACLDGTVTLTEALRVSCNTAFAQIGLDLGADALREQAEAFGFNSSFDVPMTAATSVFPDDLNRPQTAQSAIGQFDVRATALQMAQVTAAIANGGESMNPYLVDEVRDSDLGVLRRTVPSVFKESVTPEVAAQLNAMMVDVVKRGTGRPIAIPGVTVGGKTGTAETAPGEAPHVWFVAFAPAEQPQVAVAVVVENGGDLGSEATGGRVSAPIARAVIQAVLGSTGG